LGLSKTGLGRGFRVSQRLRTRYPGQENRHGKATARPKKVGTSIDSDEKSRLREVHSIAEGKGGKEPRLSSRTVVK